MSQERTRDGVFVCPECRGELPVGPSVRHVLLEQGCVLCGAPVTAEAFVPP